jgi:drug/metabolite transporter (DMT)-like permease
MKSATMPGKAVATKLKHNKSLSGILLMVLHAISMSILYLLSKNLSQSLHPFQVAFLYKLTILICVLPWCLQGNYKANLKTRRIGLHVARGTFSLLGTLCFFVGLSQVGMTNAAAITYLDHITVILIGFLYFKEKLSNSKLVMILFSLIGVLFIVKPGIGEFNYHYVYLFLAVIFWAMNCTVIKMLGSSERTKAQLFYVMLFSSIFSLPLALHEWKPIEPWHVKYIFAIAICYLIHAIAFFKALKYADISTVMPFDYCRLVFTGLLGIIFLNEVPDTYAVIGYLMIVFGGIYSINHETRKKHTKATPAESAKLEAEYEQL